LEDDRGKNREKTKWMERKNVNCGRQTSAHKLGTVKSSKVYAVFFEVPRGVLEKIEVLDQDFFWQND
jgi:hypothetical protein